MIEKVISPFGREHLDNFVLKITQIREGHRSQLKTLLLQLTSYLQPPIFVYFYHMTDQYIPSTPAQPISPTSSAVNSANTPEQPVKHHKLISVGIQALLYFSVFLAGFIVAKVHTLLMSL